MRTLVVSRQLSPQQTATLKGTRLTDAAYDVLVCGEDTDVITDDGAVLAKLRVGALPRAHCAALYPTLRQAATVTLNRSFGAPRQRRRLNDGSRSRTTYAEPVHSGVMGFAPREGGYRPFCRAVAFTLKHAREYAATLPLVQAMDGIFRTIMPGRYAAQREAVAKTHPAWIIPGTAFTTVAVNRNLSTAVHTDAGDLREGLSVLSVLSGRSVSGQIEEDVWRGSHLVFPSFRIAFAVRTGDVLVCDAQEWHGNTPLVLHRADAERISVVSHFRERMVECGSPAEEVVRAQERTR